MRYCKKGTFETKQISKQQHFTSVSVFPKEDEFLAVFIDQDGK